MYAIVDIETTGGFASGNGITELAILVHDGTRIVRRYNTLVNPGVSIPFYITSLTGITDSMVVDAPTFEEIAGEVYDVLGNNVFVAHNVNFDYSFIKYHLERCGYQYSSKKLCTVRLSRQIIPGLTSYSLGKLCQQLGIQILHRHRAFGDAEATAHLFTLLLERDEKACIVKALNPRSKEQLLPPNLKKADIDKLPFTCGVYYFHNARGKVIYVGKAKNIRQRVNSHFANNKPGKQKQDFIREIHQITFQECGSELSSLIFEAIEIQRLWPAYNRSLKHFEHRFSLLVFEDQRGYLRLAIDKIQNTHSPIFTVGSLLEGHSLLTRLVEKFELCPGLVLGQFPMRRCGTGIGYECDHRSDRDIYNQKVIHAIDSLKADLHTFMIMDEGRLPSEKCCLLMENGNFYGMGYLQPDDQKEDFNAIRLKLTPHKSTAYVRNLMLSHAENYPDKVTWLNSSHRQVK